MQGSAGEPESSGTAILYSFVGDRVAMMNAVDTEASLDKFKSAVREKEKKAKRKNMSIRWGRYSTVAAAFLAGLVLQAGLLGGWYLINFRTMRC